MSIEEKKEYKIRSLKRSDRPKVTKIFAKIIRQFGRSDLGNLISSSMSKSEQVSVDEEALGLRLITIGVEVLTSAIDLIEKDIEEWFSELMCVTIEEFNNMPFDIEIDIIDQLGALPEAADFFTKCWQVAKRTALYETVLNMVKRK